MSITEKIEKITQKISKESRKLQLLLDEPPPIRQPIFLVGTARGATTLIAQTLGEHPNVKYLRFELSREWCDFANIKIACPTTGHRQSPPLGKTDVTQERADSVRQGFAKLVFIQGGTKNTYFLNKSPHLWNKLPFVSEIFPDARLVVTSRDIRSTVASIKPLWQKLNQRYKCKHFLPHNSEFGWEWVPNHDLKEVERSRSFPGGDVRVIAEYWLRVYQTIEKKCLGFQSVTLCRHQDLLQQPKATLNKICSDLDLAPAPFSSISRLDSQRNSRWREILTPNEQKALDAFIEENYQNIKQLKYADTTI